ncbi:MAG: 1-deoxy-D-xylulose-5-phosphate reductoisomerase [Candidatus Dormibacteria bacterium]
MPTRVGLIGATGSIGRQALDIIGRFPEHFQLVGAVAGSRVEALERALRPFPAARRVVIAPDTPPPPGMAVGAEEAAELAGAPDLDVVVVGGGGAGALLPTLAACRAGHLIALATKEVLVMAGELVTAEASAHGARIVPVDSEHSALWQCLRGEDPATVSRLILTASGGALRDWPLEHLDRVSAEQALRHPNWRMGPKVTVDTATMVNKGLEVIEAHFLFQVPYDRIEVVLHPQSTVHSAVEFCDGAVVAQLGVPDMRLPIALAMSDGRRLPGVVAGLQLAQVGSLEFQEVDQRRFPALAVVRRAGVRGGAVPAVLNAANEVAVAAFLQGRIGFLEIASLIESVTEAFRPEPSPGLEQLLAADAWGREQAEARIRDSEPAPLPAAGA